MAETRPPFVNSDYIRLYRAIKSAQHAFRDAGDKNAAKPVSIDEAMEELRKAFKGVNTSPLRRVSPVANLPGELAQRIRTAHTACKTLSEKPKDEITEEEWEDISLKTRLMKGVWFGLTKNGPGSKEAEEAREKGEAAVKQGDRIESRQLKAARLLRKQEKEALHNADMLQQRAEAASGRKEKAVYVKDPLAGIIDLDSEEGECME